MALVVYADEYSDSQLPVGVPTAETERDFLHAVLAGEDFVVRGRTLTRWAREYYAPRGIEVIPLLSPSRRLVDLCFGELSTADALTLFELGGGSPAFGSEFDLIDVAATIWPEDWWRTPSEAGLAAGWLCWIALTDLSKIPTPFLTHLAAVLAAQSGPAEKPAFRITDRERAFSHLYRWLGAGDSLGYTRPFPIALAPGVKSLLLEKLNHEAMASDGSIFFELLAAEADSALLRLAAKASARFFLANRGTLDSHLLGQMSPFLKIDQVKQLQEILPTPELTVAPEDPAEYGKWYVEEYLPRRVRSGDSANPNLHSVARDFGERYLRAYAEAVQGGPGTDLLSWRAAAKGARHPAYVTLMLVLDGLTYADMLELWGHLRDGTIGDRLEVLSSGVVFSPLPTITEIAKSCVVKGASPNAVSEEPDLGSVLKHEDDVVRALSAASAGEVVIWSILEPDATYHAKVMANGAPANASGALYAVARRLREAAEKVPSQVQLRIIVTTDHGRLMQPSHRELAVPAGMRAHGRAALGGRLLKAPFVVESDVAMLHRDSYGLAEDCAVALSEASFVNEGGGSGTETFPHGGVYPEEVLIPWWVIARDGRLEPLRLKVTGKGVVGKPGVLTLWFSNEGAVPLVATELRLTLGEGVETVHNLSVGVGAMSSESIPLPLAPWPSSAEAKNASGRLLTRMPDSALRLSTAEVLIEAEEMYGATDNPLEGLL